MNAPDSPRFIEMEQFQYELPEDRIALYPLEERDLSRLLVYKNGNLHETSYRQLAAEIPSGTTLVFNNTRVVQARLHLQKPSGGLLELFCLEPDPRYPDITTAMLQTGDVFWTCLVGGIAKWKNGQALSWENQDKLKLEARLIQRNEADATIHFTWNKPTLSFAEVLQDAGKIPIPPYIKRAAAKTDQERYQTVYAREDGSVAAPTAGLHFTEELIAALAQKDIQTAMVTLHVGAGTFKPVKSPTIADHEMHSEWIELEEAGIRQLMAAEGKLVAVGTTSLRTLETIYWMGVKAHYLPAATLQELSISQWEIYDNWQEKAIPVQQALNALLSWMKKENTTKLLCKTSILIAPGYTIRMVKGIITNFHQPGSTLLLLVAAIIGTDWKKVYEYALKNEFRFLSYGDGSLLWCNS